MDGSQFRRRTGGVLRARYLTTQAYRFDSKPSSSEEFLEIVSLVFNKVADNYTVVDRYDLEVRGLYSIVYRFQHSGDPVSQALIAFQDNVGWIYLIELTGHRKDEDTLKGDARQVVHSIVRS